MFNTLMGRYGGVAGVGGKEHRQYRFIVLGGYGTPAPGPAPSSSVGGNGGTADYTIDTTNLDAPITLLYRQASGGPSPLVSGGHGAYISTATSTPQVTGGNILAAAGGGGGASSVNSDNGGAGGGPVGADSPNSPIAGGGSGGTQLAGGAGTGPGTGTQDGKPGAFLSGGAGGVNPGGPSFERGGGGGGGYYGGGGGRGAGPTENSSGGGGSGHANTTYSLYATGSTTQGNRPSIAPGVGAPTTGTTSYVYVTSAPVSEGTSGPVASKTWTDLNLDNTDKFITLDITTGEFTLS